MTELRQQFWITLRWLLAFSFILCSATQAYAQSVGSLKVIDVSERNREGRNALAVTLSSTLDPGEDFQSFFNVSVKKAGLVDGGWVLSDSGKIAWFDHSEPNTHYEVSIYQGLKAANGQVLKQSFTSSIITRDLTATASFDTQGVFLGDGANAGLPVTAVNTPEINIDFYKIRDDEINEFLSDMEYKSSYPSYVNRVSAYGDLAYSGRYKINAPKNTRVNRSIRVASAKPLRQPGVYLAVLHAAGEYYDKDLLWFSVTDIGLHLRQYENQMDVHVSSLASGKAMANVSLSLLDNKNQIIKEARSTKNGLVSFMGDLKDAHLLIAKNKNHFSLIELKKPALDLSEFDLGHRPQLPVEFFVYSPRDLYRPGEIIDFNGLLRNGDGRPTQAATLPVSIRRPNGSIATEFNWHEDQAGYYHHTWLIPSDAPLGNWELVVRGPLKKPAIYPFKVEEFLPERLKLTFPDSSVEQDAAQPMSVPVIGEYLYGAPASGNRLGTRVNVRQWREALPQLPNYVFGHIEENPPERNFDLPDYRLDDEGKITLAFESRWKRIQSPLKVTLISSVYESGGRAVSRSHTQLIWPHDTHLGIRPHFGDNNPDANTKISFDIVNADAQGQLHAAPNLDVQLIREERQYFWTHDSNRGWYWDWTDKEYTANSQSLSITGDKKAQIHVDVEWGNYRLEVRNPENNTITSLRFYAGYNWYSRWQDSQQGSDSARPDKVTLALDKGAYLGGDIAQLNIVPPEAGEVLVLVEGDRPLWSKRIRVGKDGKKVEIPIDPSWQQHNIYITTLLLQPSSKKKNLTPKRSFGLIHLPLDREARKLDIEINIPNKSLPNTALQAELTVRRAPSNSSDNPGNSNNQADTSEIYLTLAAVDVGVLSISDFETPDPHEAFFGQRRYEVSARDLYHKVIEQQGAKEARLRFGGDEDLSHGGDAPKSQVQIVSLFSGRVTVDADGRAIVPLNLPDFNGRLRLMALAFSDSAFGHSDKELTVAADIVTQIAMPRFLATGDKSQLAVDFRNMTDKVQSLSTKFSLMGPVTLLESDRKTDSIENTMVLQPKEKRTLNFPVEATGYQHLADIRLEVSGKGIKDFDRYWQLGVRPPYPAIIQQHRKVLSAGEQLTVKTSQLPKALPGSIKSLISINSTPNMNLQSQLQHLLAYPYGCLEQTTSRAFPLTYASEANQARFGIKTVNDEKRLDMINTGINRLSSLQLNNGGYGLWSNRSNEEHWLTAYVGDFLLSAEDMGVHIPQKMLDKTLKRLKAYVNRNGRYIRERWSHDPKHYTFAYKAYAAYVLSRVNQAPLGSLRQLYDNKFDHARSPLSQVQLGIALVNMGDKKRGQAAIKKALKEMPSYRDKYYGDYGSLIRDTGMMIHLLSSIESTQNDAKKLSFYLADAIQQERWFSTQERSALFLAGIALNQHMGSTWQAELILGNAEPYEKISAQGNTSRLLDDEQSTQGFSVRSTADTLLFVDVQISAHGTEAPKPSSNELSIERQWYNSEGKAIKLSTAKVGELFIAHISVSAEHRVPDALVVDLLPAGFELENQNLAHAINLDDFKIDGKKLSKLMAKTKIKHQEFRDDRYVAALDIRRHSVMNLFYMVRAVSPGIFKVPAPLVEDMYRPERRAIGSTEKQVEIKNVAQ